MSELKRQYKNRKRTLHWDFLCPCLMTHTHSYSKYVTSMVTPINKRCQCAYWIIQGQTGPLCCVFFLFPHRMAWYTVTYKLRALFLYISLYPIRSHVRIIYSLLVRLFFCILLFTYIIVCCIFIKKIILLF